MISESQPSVRKLRRENVSLHASAVPLDLARDLFVQDMRPGTLAKKESLNAIRQRFKVFKER